MRKSLAKPSTLVFFAKFLSRNETKIPASVAPQVVVDAYGERYGDR